MAKKTFKDSITNPAEFFITGVDEYPENTEKEAETLKRTAGELQGNNKKTEKKLREKQSGTNKRVPKGYKLNPLYVETKSKRLQLLVTPTLLEALKKRAKTEKRSVNDLVNSILEESLEG